MVNPVKGYQVGDRVRALETIHSAPFNAKVLRVVVPKSGERFAILVDFESRTHHRYFHELEAIETAQA